MSRFYLECCVCRCISAQDREPDEHVETDCPYCGRRDTCVLHGDIEELDAASAYTLGEGTREQGQFMHEWLGDFIKDEGVKFGDAILLHHLHEAEDRLDKILALNRS